jgi:hypothetical protein
LHYIKKIFFIDELKAIDPPLVCPAHEHFIWSFPAPISTPLPIYCSKIDIDPNNPYDLEYLRKFSFKGYEGSRPVKNTFQDEFSSSYTEPLKFHKVNIGSEYDPKITSIGDY